MKKILFAALAAALYVSFATAQNNPQNQGRRSDRKIIEIQKIVTLTPAQESTIRAAHDAYNRRNDSILLKVPDGAQATALKRQSDKSFQQQLLATLTADQKRQYLSITVTPEVSERTEAKMEELRETGDYTTAQLDSARQVIYRQLLDEKILSSSDKQKFRQQRAETAGQKREQSQRQRSNRKITELKKMIDLTPGQEEILRSAYIKHQEQGDSILQKVKDAALASELSYRSNRELHSVLMNTLTEAQRNRYIRIDSTPEVWAKAAAKVAELAETGDYTEAQLAEAQTEIFDYLMLEKIVYARDKYDLRKQKENIRKLKGGEPTHLKRANAREKMRTQGKSEQGIVQW